MGSYAEWIAAYDTLDDNKRRLAVRRVAGFRLRPQLSVVMPVYNTDLRWLREAIDPFASKFIRNWNSASPTMRRQRPA